MIGVPFSKNPQYVRLHCKELTLMILVQDIIREDLTQFAFCSPDRMFKGATVILLFTHLDLLEEDIRRNVFKDDFPDYTGRQNDSIAAREFIAQKFRGLRTGMTIFFTNATDIKEFSKVLSQIEDLMKTRCREEQLHAAESDDN